MDMVSFLVQYLDDTHVLICNKSFYLNYKEDLDNLLKQNCYMFDVIITDILEDEKCIIMGKEKFNLFFKDYYKGSDKE